MLAAATAVGQRSFRSLPRCLLVAQRTTFHNATATSTTTTTSWLLSTSSSSSLPQLCRGYGTRAHPEKKPLFALPIALDEVLKNVKKRQKRRTKRWKSHAPSRARLGLAGDGEPYRPMDETIEMNINLNVDPRKPGQSLRGSLSLPQGSGKRVAVVVFTDNEELATQAKEMGALHVGGDELMDQIVAGEISVDSFQRSLATSDVMPQLSKKLARLLGPRGLMPNPKVGTVAQPGELLELLQDQLAGREVQYRTEKEGIIALPVGKSSFGSERILENVGAVMNKIYEIKPESYGKTKKKKKGGGKGKTVSMDTYIISAYVASTYTKGYKIDLRTLDPSSAYFLSDPNQA